MAAGFVVESERQAFERFRNDLAPSGWVIAHNLYFSARREDRGISGNELDLLLVHRDHGIIIVEVKGGRSYDRVRDGTWRQDGVPMKSGPRTAGEQLPKQAQGALCQSLTMADR